MIAVYKNKELCCGCEACVQKCPVKCITMELDDEGFRYPFFDETKCIHCNKCEKVCPILMNEGFDAFQEEVYPEPVACGGWNRDEAIRAVSSSGGVFTLFAEEVLKKNGVVYGAAFTDVASVSHVSVRTKKELGRLRGSKYTQSNMHEVYSEVQQDLKDGKTVLFSGTPCQNAALLSFLGHADKRLYLMDFICHGVPSPGVFSQYIDSLGKSNHSAVTDFKFRLKDKGWSQTIQLGTKITFANGTVIRNYPALKDPYMNGFSEDLYLRPSCYSCPFKKIPKYTSDITIGDFWGINKVMPEMNDGKGTSLILINNKHGEELFDRIKKDFAFKVYPDWKTAVRRNQSLLKSAVITEDRKGFYELLNKSGFEAASKKYLSTGRTIRKKATRIAWNKFESLLFKMVSSVCSLLHRPLSEELWKQLLQFVKFCIVGASNVIVAYTINITTLKTLSLKNKDLSYDYVIANTVAFILSVYWSYFWNSRKVFSMSHARKADRRRTLLRTYACYGFTGIILNNILSTFWIKGIGISKYISPLLNLFITIPINFLTNKYWAYAKRDESENG